MASNDDEDASDAVEAADPPVAADVDDARDAADAADDGDACSANADPDPYRFLGPNSPGPGGKRKSRKCVHELFRKGAAMRLKPGHEGLELGFTHQCTCPLDTAGEVHTDEVGTEVPFCGVLLRCGYDKNRDRWISTKASDHMRVRHPDSVQGSNGVKRSKVIKEKKKGDMFKAGMNAAGKSDVTTNGAALPRNSVANHFQLSPQVQDLTSSARFYVYGQQRISKRTLDDPYFQAALKGSNINRSMLSRHQLENYVRAEFALFVVFLKHLVKKKLIQTMGNPFAQGLHDGVTLGNHKGYESLGIDVVDTDWDRNLPICVGFAPKPMRKNGSFDGSDAAVGLLFDNILQERTGYSLKEIMCGMTSDRAAGGVARKLGLEDRACLMHDVDKLGQSCSGGLLRRDMTKPIGPDGHRPYANPFPEGVALMRQARRMGLHYSTGTRFSTLMTLRSTSHLATKSSSTRMKMPKNETRVASEHGLLMSQARLNQVVKVDCQIHKHRWMFSDDEWRAHAEFEGVLHLTQISSTEAQYEKLFLGAYAALIKAVTLHRLREDAIPVLRYDDMTDSAKLVRPPMRVSDFTATGRKCLERARLEGERRFCNNKTEHVDGALPVVFGDNELLATLLDIRTVHCKHLTKTQRNHATEIYKTEYVKYYRVVEKFEAEVASRKKAAVTAAAEDEVVEVEDNLPVPSRPVYMGITNDNAWSDDEPEEVEEVEDVVHEMSDAQITDIATEVLKNFRTMKIDWRKEFPDAVFPAHPAQLDIFNDLMQLNPGKVYMRLESSDVDRKKYGLISRMAAGSKGCIGFLPAASFCERVNSVAKDVMTDAHTLMCDEALEMLVVLRINRKFMEYMRSKYNSLTQDQFGMTLVELLDDAERTKS